MSRGCKEQLLVSKVIHLYRRNIMYSMVWLQESIRQRASLLDSHCHGDVVNMSNNKTIRGDNDERMKD